MLRSTKIVATLGPSSSDPAILERMFRAGVDVVRLNFSHGTADDHLRRAELVKELSRKIGRTVAIMCDLQGPKIRVGKFKDGKITLEKGQPFVLDAGCAMGDAGRAGLDYKELPRDVEPGAVLLLDDGKIVLDVVDVRGEEVHTTVPNVPFLLTTERTDSWAATPPALACYNKIVNEFVATGKAVLVDLNAIFCPPTSGCLKKDRNGRPYYADGVHLSSAGQAFVALYLEKKITEVSAARPPTPTSTVPHH